MSFRRTAARRNTNTLQRLTLALLLVLTAVSNSQADDGSTPEVLMRTTMGDMVIQLDRERAPATVRNFLAYVDDNFYADTLFHRVIEGFMIQGGGFTNGFQRKTTRPPVSNEAYNGLRNQRYTIAMARTTAPHSATSQFFINSEDNRNLDHTATTQRGWGYTVFGRVVQGQDIVDAISRTRTKAGGPFSRDVPVEPIVILGVERMATPSPASEPVEGAAAANPVQPVVQQSSAGTDKSLIAIDRKEGVSSEVVKQN